MSIVKSFSVGRGDMFYIKHGNSNFTVIDCYLPGGNQQKILAEIEKQRQGKKITRFISTHPDEDHIGGLNVYDDKFGIVNFYCVKNQTSKSSETDSFRRYKELRNSDKAYHVEKGCSRQWMNRSGNGRGSSGINFLWPDVDNKHYKTALQNAKSGRSPNNISTVCTYALNGGAKFIWMGDLETEFMESIEDSIDLTECDILFAPHHGRKSGRVPSSWLNKINPKLIVVGEADSDYLEYYKYWNTITQNTVGDIEFECVKGSVHIYTQNPLLQNNKARLVKDNSRLFKTGYNGETYRGSITV